MTDSKVAAQQIGIVGDQNSTPAVTSVNNAPVVVPSPPSPQSTVFPSSSSSEHEQQFETNNSSNNNNKMSPKPYDDGLFIEPAGDYDVVYGDYNATMSDGTPAGKRPYIRLTSALRNMTRPVGGEVRMRCEAAGAPMPIQFTWLKNLAPVEKDRRVRIRHREQSSKLVIVELDVLDSGYYQCTANNAAGSVNSTAVLRVSPSIPSSASSSSSASLQNKKKLPTAGGGGTAGNNRLQHLHQHNKHLQQGENDDYDTNVYDNYMDEEMKSGDAEEMDDVWRVSGSAAGPGYVPMRRQGAEADGRWLDGQMVRKGDCIAYRGEACAQFLAGKHVKVLVDREQIYDAEKDLLAALMTVRVMPGVSEQCRQLSHQVACYHMFKVCDPSVSSIAGLASPSGTDIISLCRADCDSLKSSVCPNEFAMAAQHDLVGDTPKALLPNCDALLPGAQRCLSVLDKQRPQQSHPPMLSPASPPSSSADGTSSSSSSSASHWCFVGHGTKYVGTASNTRSNRPCIYWPATPNTEFNTDAHPQLRHAKNHCRNPSRRSQFNEPWCYTLSPGSQSLVAEPCNVPRCPPNLYPELDDAHSLDGGSGGSSSSMLDSLSSIWHSMSAQTQVLAFTSGLGTLALLLFMLAFCCICCRRNSGRRRKSSRNGTANGVGGGAGGGMCRGTMQQESASSMLSGSVVASAAVQQKMAMAAQQQQPGMPHPHMLVQSCNGGSTITGSDLNSAFYRKVRDERMRACAADELLNPLLPPYGATMLDQQQQQQMAAAAVAAYPQQQQMFEMKKQQQQQPPQHQQQFRHYWEAVGTLNSASAVGSTYPAYYGAQSMQSLPMHPPLSQQQAAYNNQNNHNSPHTSTEPPPAEPYQIAHIQEQQLKFFDRCLGEDAHTQLTLGEWVGGMISGAKLQVALKTLKQNMPHIAAEQFREEIQAIGFFEHPNVLRLFGVSFMNGHDICAVFDYMVHGDLVEFLKVREPRGAADDEQERQRNAEDFLRIGTQITGGCAYLAANGFVHRDLAARNCLVGDQQVIKIANFARMKPQYERDYYRMNTNCRGVPLRWMSKEALNEGKYSQASDVYAFGVCLWEIYTYARQPYEGCTDEQVIQLIQEDNYLEIPEFCPPAVYAQMVECFNANTGRRPSFAELNTKFQKWCQSGQASALLMQQHRASSVHSGGSSTGVNGMLANGGGALSHQTGGGGRMGGGGGNRHHNHHHQLPPGGNVPSPAPNASTTILAGNLGGTNNINNNHATKNGGHLAKLALLGNGGAALIHSTPIAQNQSDDKNGAARPVPLARRRQRPTAAATKAYTDDDELDDEDDAEREEEEEDYSSEESRDT